MGIKDLTSFLKEHAPDSITKTSLSEFSNKKVAIDISIFMYKFKYKNKNIIEKFLEQIYRLAMNNITPVYIFDGIPPKEKMDTINQRKEKFYENIDKLKELQSELETTENMDIDANIKNVKMASLKININSINDKLIRITKEDISKIKYFFDLFNIKYIQADGEADLLCSKLNKLGIVNMVMSEDMDILTSGASILLRDFLVSNNKITKIDLQTILQKLNFTYEQWVDFCILCGCDYLKRIPGVGPKCAFKKISLKNVDSISVIDDIINNQKNKNKDIDSDYKNKFMKAKHIFMDMDNVNLEKYKTYIEDKGELYDNQLKNIRHYLFKHTSLTDLKINNRLKAIFKSNI